VVGHEPVQVAPCVLTGQRGHAADALERKPVDDSDEQDSHLAGVGAVEVLLILSANDQRADLVLPLLVPLRLAAGDLVVLGRAPPVEPQAPVALGVGGEDGVQQYSQARGGVGGFAGGGEQGVLVARDVQLDRLGQQLPDTGEMVRHGAQ
jgi:hypothetical protein